jgi:hypothetical protein
VVGNISVQHIRVFAMFAAAMLMTGLAYAFSNMGETGMALTASATTFAFVSAIILEAQNS